MISRGIKINPDCKNCELNNYCCHDFHITLSEKEAKKYKYKRLRRIYEGEKFLGWAWTLICNENGFCNYFDEINKKCSIYDNRPEVCKSWKECVNGNKQRKRNS